MNQRGQMTMEAMLILLILLSIEMLISNTAKQQHWMSTLVGAPWKPVQAMIEDGTWQAQNSKEMNPTSFKRHGSSKGDAVE